MMDLATVGMRRVMGSTEYKRLNPILKRFRIIIRQ